VFAFAPRALAEPPVAGYEAFTGCPTRAELVERIRARMGMGTSATRVPGDVSLHVRVTADRGATHGTVEIRRGEEKTQRSVDGRRCDEVVDALALIAALALREDAARTRKVGAGTRSEQGQTNTHNQQTGDRDANSRNSSDASSRENPAARDGARSPGSVGSSDTRSRAASSSGARKAGVGSSDAASAARSRQNAPTPSSGEGSPRLAGSPDAASAARSRQNAPTPSSGESSPRLAGSSDAASAARPRQNAPTPSIGEDSPRLAGSPDAASAARPRQNAPTPSGGTRGAGSVGSSDATSDARLREDPTRIDTEGSPRSAGSVDAASAARSPESQLGAALEGEGGSNNARGSDAESSPVGPGPRGERASGSAPAQRADPDEAAARSGSADPHDSPDSDAWQLGARIGATGLVFSGLAPALQPGLQLQAALVLSSGAFAYRVELGGRIARTDELVSPAGDARFGFSGGVVRVCAANALGSTPLALTGCAVAEPGVYAADGENTRNRRTHSRLWLAVGAAADLSVRVLSWAHVRIGGELLAPVRRDTIWLAGESLYRVPALGLRLQLGVEVPFG